MEVVWLEIDMVRSHWYRDIMEDWQPEPGYIRHLLDMMRQGGYVPPVVAVLEDGAYVLVNGHHRYYAHLVAGEKKIKALVIDGAFEDSEPLRKAEVLLKEYDQSTGYKYQVSGYLDRWAAAVEKHDFVNTYRPVYRVGIGEFARGLLRRIRLALSVGTRG